MDEQSFGEKLDKHLARWRELAANPASVPTNLEMGERAANDLCRRYAGKPPAAVVWCESPFQFAVLPAVAVNVLDAAGREAWKALLARVNARAAAGSAEWEAAWTAEWPQFAETTLRPMIKHISSHPRLRKTHSAVLDRLEQDAAAALHRLAVINPSGTWSIFDEKVRKNHVDGYGAPPSDIACAKGGVRLQQRVNELLQLSPITPAVTSGMAIGLGVWDSRLLKKYVPAAKFVLGEDRRAQISALEMVHVQVAHEKCRELETVYARLGGFWQAIANEPMRFDFEDLVNRPQSVRPIDALQTMHRSFETTKRELRTNVATGYAIWLPYQFAWIPFALSCRFLKADPLAELNDEIDDWGLLSRAALACNFTKHFAFLLKKPLSISFNENQRVHNESGAAILWGDGAESYVWKGVIVDRGLIFEPEKITHRDISKEMNAEARRVKLDRYGEARYLRDAGARKIHEDDCGILYRTELWGDEPLVMVKVKNSTPEPDGTYKHYYLRVPPNMMRAKEAVAWTFGVDEKDYHPGLQT